MANDSLPGRGRGRAEAEAGSSCRRWRMLNDDYRSDPYIVGVLTRDRQDVVGDC